MARKGGLDQGRAECGQIVYGRQISHRDQGAENCDELERESKIEGHIVKEPGGEEISRKAEYWQGGETA